MPNPDVRRSPLCDQPTVITTFVVLLSQPRNSSKFSIRWHQTVNLVNNERIGDLCGLPLFDMWFETKATWLHTHKEGVTSAGTSMARRMLNKSGCQINLTSPLNFSEGGSFRPSDFLQTPPIHSKHFVHSTKTKSVHNTELTEGTHRGRRSETKPATSPFDSMHFLAQHVQGNVAAHCYLRHFQMLKEEGNCVAGSVQPDDLQRVITHVAVTRAT